MLQTKFKSGMIVRCIKPYAGVLDYGKLYKVVEIKKAFHFPEGKFVLEGHSNYAFFNNRFEPVFMIGQQLVFDFMRE